MYIYIYVKKRYIATFQEACKPEINIMGQNVNIMEWLPGPKSLGEPKWTGVQYRNQIGKCFTQGN